MYSSCAVEQGTDVDLTFRHRASSVKDRRFAPLQRTLFIYLINQYISQSDIFLDGASLI